MVYLLLTHNIYFTSFREIKHMIIRPVQGSQMKLNFIIFSSYRTHLIEQ